MLRCMSYKLTLSILICGNLWASGVSASQNVTQTAQQAISFSPDVQNSWYNFLKTGDDIDSARGGYKPTLDFHANYGREIRTGSGWSSGTESPFNGGRAELSFVQMLYDGFQTTGYVESAEGQQLVSYFQMLSQIQNTALDAYAAHLDVVRNRQLVSLAEDNLDQHQRVYRQVQRSSGAGVTNAADLDQITGRLSLAQANLITAKNELRKVESRYLRVVGSDAPVDLSVPDTMTLPPSSNDAEKEALKANPEFLGALYNIQASEAAVEASKSGYHPQVNLTARYGSQDYDDRGLDNSRTDGRIAIEFHYNLYNGGRDKAAIRKAYNEVNRSKAERDSVCYSLRQNVQVAFDDTRRVSEQIPVLRQHQQSSDRVRRAYQEQFLIGRRSLMDVLDSENEHFQASRALINAQYDQLIATARTKAAMGTLLPSLGVVRKDLPSLSDLDDNPVVVDPDTACPQGYAANSFQY